MFKQTRRWLRWVGAVVKWRYYRNAYEIKEWLAVNRIIKFKRQYSRQDIMRLGIMADWGVYTPLSYSAYQHNKLKRHCEMLEGICASQAELLDSIVAQIQKGYSAAEISVAIARTRY